MLIIKGFVRFALRKRDEGSIPFTRSNLGFVGVLANIEVHKVKSKN